MKIFAHLVRLVAVLAFAYMAAWKVLGLRWQWVLCAVVASAWCHRRDNRTLKELGFTWGNWMVTVASISVALLSAATVVALAARGSFTFYDILPAKLGYVFFAIVQEFFFQSFVFIELKTMFGGRPAVVLTALIFASLHLFNPVLTPATLVMGLALSWLFLKNRSLYQVAALHAIFGIAAMLVLPGKLMIVGANYRPH